MLFAEYFVKKVVDPSEEVLYEFSKTLGDLKKDSSGATKSIPSDELNLIANCSNESTYLGKNIIRIMSIKS